MTIVEHRRSQRLLLDVPVIIRGESAREQSFQEETFTIVVSAHGALVVLAAKVVLGQRLLLTNPKTGDEREGRVASLGSPYGGLTQVGIAFTRPAPEFWPLSPTPDAWKAESDGS
ncbi:MAG TPA: hypothetical protein VHM88_01775 [Candidatus Acidoferrales bacterium]|nr:hypothetical protein [Candidatus Acidoferrales bacterium]